VKGPNKRLESIKRLRAGTTFRPKDTYPHLEWIISRYLFYLSEALIYGFTIKVYRAITNAVIRLNWAPYEKPTRFKKKMYMYSKRVFDYIFYVSITGIYIDSRRYDFFIEKQLRDRIEEKLNTDAIYQFVKQ
jgi:hypothetical protein